jgi:hypothetical protein
MDWWDWIGEAFFINRYSRHMMLFSLLTGARERETTTPRDTTRAREARSSRLASPPPGKKRRRGS